MKYLYVLLLILPIALFSQDVYQDIPNNDNESIYEENIDSYTDTGYAEYPADEEILEEDFTTNEILLTNKAFITQQNSNFTGFILQTPQTNIYLTIPSPPYKSYRLSDFKSKKIPQLLSSEGMLQNLDGTIWRLKFYSHLDTPLFKSIELKIKNSLLSISITNAHNQEKDKQEYYLTPIKMFKPNEGIFAYSNKKGEIFFIYMRLLLRHLLAVEMTSTYEDAERSSSKSLVDLGVFILQ